MDPSAIVPGLTFGLITILFLAGAVFLGSLVIDGSLTFQTAATIYLPLLVCWFGISLTFNGPLAFIAVLLGIAAIAYSILVPLRMITGLNQMNRELADDKVKAYIDWLQKHPTDGSTHFKLAEIYEDRGWLKEALHEYTTVSELEKGNKAAHYRVRLLEQKLREQESRGGINLASIPASPEPLREHARNVQTQNVQSQAVEPRPGAVLMIDGPESPAPPVEPLRVSRVDEITQALLVESENPALHAALGEELAIEGRLGEASEAYRKALWLDPSNEEYSHNFRVLLQPDYVPGMLMTAPVETPSTETLSAEAPSTAEELAARPKEITTMVETDTAQQAVTPGEPPAEPVPAHPRAGSDGIVVPPRLDAPTPFPFRNQRTLLGEEPTSEEGPAA